MGIPKQALEAEAAANLAIAQAEQAKNNPPAEEVTTLSPEVQAEPKAEAEIVEPQNVVVETPESIQNQDELADLRAEVARERQLRRTLEGRLKSQLKPANEEIRKLRKEIAEAQEDISKMITESKKPGAERLLNEDEIADLGDVLDVNTRMVRGILEESLESGDIAKTIEMMVSKSKAVREATEDDAFQGADTGPSDDFWVIVDQYAPGSRETNRIKDPAWLDFLDEYNALSGDMNRSIAEQAMAEDSPMVLVELFEAYWRQNGKVADTKARAPQVKPDAAPRGTPANLAPAPEEAFTQLEIQAFYNDLARGKFKGRQSEAETIERNIMAAVEAGRVT